MEKEEQRFVMKFLWLKINMIWDGYPSSVFGSLIHRCLKDSVRFGDTLKQGYSPGSFIYNSEFDFRYIGCPVDN
jgi:hypothetical protein